VVQVAIRRDQFQTLLQQIRADADNRFHRLAIKAIKQGAFGGAGTPSGIFGPGSGKAQGSIPEIFMIVSNNFAVIVSLAQ
jgi:hypothetical protein